MCLLQGVTRDEINRFLKQLAMARCHVKHELGGVLRAACHGPPGQVGAKWMAIATWYELLYSRCMAFLRATLLAKPVDQDPIQGVVITDLALIQSMLGHYRIKSLQF